MLNEYNADISNLFRRHRRKLIFRPLLVALSIMVVFATAYMLILPGVTLEKGTVCGQIEHVHNADCYEPVLVCGIEESEFHTHSEACYEEKLACGLEEHIHQDSCYASSAAPLTAEPSVTPTDKSAVKPSVEPTAMPTVTPTAEPTTEPTGMPSMTPTVTPAAEYSFENDAISVKAVLSEDTVLPADAKLQVMDITQESDPERYSAFQKLLLPVMDDTATDTSSEPGLLAYDIGFFVDGVEIEPTGGSVQVTIDYKSPSIDAGLAADVTMYHVVETESAAVLESVQDIQSVISDEGTVESITFATDSLSPFIIPASMTMSSSLHYLLIDQEAETFMNTSYYDASNPLGIAGNFHVVAFNTATLKSHTNGNILAKNLSTTSNFGTKNYGSELSYIQNYLQIVGGSSADNDDILVIGSSNSLLLFDNGNHFAIAPPGSNDTKKIDQPWTVWQDNDTALLPFVNLTAVKTQIQEISSYLANQPNNNITPSTADMNNASLTLAPSATLGVYKLTADELAGGFFNGINVYSLTGTATNNDIIDPNKITSVSDTVIINIDCQNKAVMVPPVRMFLDGYLYGPNGNIRDNYVRASEVTSPVTGVTGKIILNFFNSAGVTITLKDTTYATVIAPDANIIVESNVNGTIIGENVNINKETHRTDFTGSFPLGRVTVKKEWYASNGTTPLSAASIDGLSVSVQLYSNNTAMSGYTATLDSTNNWSTIWANLPVRAGQKYTVKEVSISKNGTVIQTGETAVAYSVAYTNNAGIFTGIITIKNIVASGSVQVTKIWHANDGTALTGTSIAGLSASVQLYSNNVAMVGAAYTVTLNAANSWSYTWSGLDIGSGQKYTVKETEIGGYAVTYENNSGIQNGIISVNNTRGQPFVLPATGGGGTNILYAVGTVMLLSVFLLTGMKIRYRKRKGGQSSA